MLEPLSPRSPTPSGTTPLSVPARWGHGIVGITGLLGTLAAVGAGVGILFPRLAEVRLGAGIRVLLLIAAIPLLVAGSRSLYAALKGSDPGPWRLWFGPLDELMKHFQLPP